jgi:predicted DNA-binding transcriptional regulator YafY
MNSVRDDIEQIQRIYPGADVESYREGRNIYYRYADPEFSIFKTPMKPDEIIQLTQTLRLLGRFKGMPQFEWVDEIVERLGASLKLDESTDEIVGFDENLDLEGMDNFTPLFNAIVDKQPLKLTYQSFKQDNEETIIVHPYYLKQYNKRWFLIAWNEEKDFMANYAFDRIKRIEDANVLYMPTDVNFFDYFEDMIGVSKDTRTEPQTVKLWVSAAQWPYIKTKPLHGATQRLVTLDEKGAVITIEVYINYELEQLLLSFGEKVKVLEPVELKERIKQRLTDAANNYLE